jgi:hypothetical protein
LTGTRALALICLKKYIWQSMFWLPRTYDIITF